MSIVELIYNSSSLLHHWLWEFRCQFHQHFTYKFFVRMSFCQLFLVTFWLWQKSLFKKHVRQMLMKLTVGVNFIDIWIHRFMYESVVFFIFRLCLNILGKRQCWKIWIQSNTRHYVLEQTKISLKLSKATLRWLKLCL